MSALGPERPEGGSHSRPAFAGGLFRICQHGYVLYDSRGDDEPGRRDIREY